MSAHTCHWRRCTVEVPPSLWGCPKHWYRLPHDLRRRLSEAYVPGQEITKTPSQAYLAVAMEIQDWILLYG